MDEDLPALQIALDMRTYIRAYVYPYQDEVRITISIENDDSVISQDHLKPTYSPFTGKRISHDEHDMRRLSEGITLRMSNGRPLLKCCFLEGKTLHLQVKDIHMHHEFAYDPATGSRP